MRTDKRRTEKPHGRKTTGQCGKTAAAVRRGKARGRSAERDGKMPNGKAALPEEPEENPAAGGVIKRTKPKKRNGPFAKGTGFR